MMRDTNSVNMLDSRDFYRASGPRKGKHVEHVKVETAKASNMAPSRPVLDSLLHNFLVSTDYSRELEVGTTGLLFQPELP